MWHISLKHKLEATQTLKRYSRVVKSKALEEKKKKKKSLGLILGCVALSLEFLLYRMEIVKGCQCPVHIPLAFTSLIVNSRNSWPEGFFCSHPSGGQAGCGLG